MIMIAMSRRGLVSGVLSSAVAGPALAQQNTGPYPDRPIKIICASPPGGGTDASSRTVGRRLQELWGQPAVIENRSGGANNIAAELVAKSDPDGYTLLSTTGNVVFVNAALFKRLNYNPAALEPVATLGQALSALTVRKSFPAKTVQEFITYAKANPGKVTFGSTGAGSSVHLAMELLQMRTGLQLVHVPYRGMTPLVNDLAGGHVDIAFTNLGPVVALHNTGQVRVIAVPETKRLTALPDVPTLGESNLGEVRASILWLLLAPPKTPRAIRAKLNKEIVSLINTPEYQSMLEKLEAVPLVYDIDQMAEYLKSEAKLWTDVVRAANVQPE
jgi:tripartite-type tricarboxylate transporter receptor subunit TctC